MLWQFSGKKKDKDTKLTLLFERVESLFDSYITYLKKYDDLGPAGQFSDIPEVLCKNEIDLMMARKELEEYLLHKNITNPVLFHTFYPDVVSYPRLKKELQYEASKD